MAEYALINGALVEMPIEVETADAAAREAWMKQQLVDRGIPHIVFGLAPVPVPAEVSADSHDIIAWATKEAARRGLVEVVPADAFDRVAREASNADVVAAIHEQIDGVVDVMTKPKTEAPATVPAAAEPAPTVITDAPRGVAVADVHSEGE